MLPDPILQKAGQETKKKKKVGQWLLRETEKSLKKEPVYNGILF